MKSINILVFSIISFLFTTTVFAQDLNDQEIGFDIDQITIELKDRGVNDRDELSRELKIMREIQIEKYLVEKKIQDDILQRIEIKQNNKKRTLRTEISVDIPQSEKNALLALYDSTNGKNWTKNTGWDFNTPVTSWNGRTGAGWYGVTVTNGHVISLSLRSNKLNGRIPVEIMQLKDLITLDLYSTGLIGNIPSEIGLLRNLEIINLANNLLTGNIPPEIGQLINLKSLDLGSTRFSYNSLTGGIPEEIGYLKKLQILKLSFNPLGGTIPSKIWDLTQLQVLSLGYNQLSGNIPSEISQLTEVVTLDLMKNQLTDVIPSAIGSLSSKLTSLNLSYNQLSGSIPIEITRLTNLTGLYLNDNKLTGNILSEMGQLSGLIYLDLGSNQLTGQIPPEINKLTKLSRLLLSSNLLEGIVPDLSGLPLKCYIRIQSEKFRFVDFDPQFLNTNRDVAYRYQADIDSKKTITRGIGTSITMTMYEDNRYMSDETFQWYKYGRAILGATSRQYIISNIMKTDAGSYHCEARHPILTSSDPLTARDLVLKRAEITLNTVLCTPIVGTIKAIR